MINYVMHEHESNHRLQSAWVILFYSIVVHSLYCIRIFLSRHIVFAGELIYRASNSPHSVNDTDLLILNQWYGCMQCPSQQSNRIIVTGTPTLNIGHSLRRSQPDRLKGMFLWRERERETDIERRRVWKLFSDPDYFCI